MELPLNGNIKDVSLVKLLVYLNRSRKTGTLALSTATSVKKLFINMGDVVFASSTNPDDRLGEMLLKAGKISVEQYDRSVEALKATGKRQGAILVELGYLTPKDLFWGVKYQVKEIIAGMFQSEDAAYVFTEGKIPTQEVITLKMSMGNLIFDSVKRIENWTRIRNEMPDTSSALRLSTDPLSLFQDISLSPQDKKILSLVDGKNTIKDVIENSWLGSFEALKILYVLWSVGMVELSTAAAGKDNAAMSADPGSFVTMSLNDVLQPNSEEEEALLKRIDSVYSVLESLSPSELLDIDDKSDTEAITRSYYRLSKEFHPDRSFSLGDPAVKAKLAAIFDAITRAYDIFRDEAGRTAYFGKTAAGGKPGRPDDPGKAEEEFKKGIEAFKKKDYSGAVGHFRAASGFEPGNAGYLNYLSLALSKIPGKLKDAYGTLQTALALDPFNPDFHANLGLINLKAGMKKKAADCFIRALKIDPTNDKAAKGLKQTEQ